jgi:hemerythrin
MHLQWSEDLSVGVDEIDIQHKELFNIINRLDSAMKQGKAREEIIRLIEFLDEYIVTHFHTEEKYMTDHGYPGYSVHKTKHNWFINEFSDIKKKFETEGPSVDVIILSNNLLISWFSNHIRTIDRALGIFLKTKI